MFDNPNQELKQLEDQLLKAEMTDEEFDRFYDELYDEFGPVEDPAEDLLSGSPVSPVRNYANGYGAQQRPVSNPQRVQSRPVQSGTQQRPQARPTQNGAQRPQPRPTQNGTQQRPQARSTQNSTPQRPQTRPHSGEGRYVPAAPKEPRLTGLVITACVECAGIVGVVLWWLLRIL